MPYSNSLSSIGITRSGSPAAMLVFGLYTVFVIAPVGFEVYDREALTKLLIEFLDEYREYLFSSTLTGVVDFIGFCSYTLRSRTLGENEHNLYSYSNFWFFR